MNSLVPSPAMLSKGQDPSPPQSDRQCLLYKCPQLTSQQRSHRYMDPQSEGQFWAQSKNHLLEGQKDRGPQGVRKNECPQGVQRGKGPQQSGVLSKIPHGQ